MISHLQCYLRLRMFRDFWRNKKIRQRYEEARRMTEELAVKDYYKTTNIDWMEELAYQMPLSSKIRPEWDSEILWISLEHL